MFGVLALHNRSRRLAAHKRPEPAPTFSYSSFPPSHLTDVRERCLRPDRFRHRCETGIATQKAAPDIALKRGIILISRSRDEGEDNAPKTAGSTREIPMLPWVVDLLNRLRRRLHFDGSESVFLSPEGKPMMDTWWPKRGAARRPVDNESKGIWFRCLRSLGIRPRKL